MAEHLSPEQFRASDADRKAVQQRLDTAHSDGQLTLDEFDLRVAATWQAKTRGDLAELTKDLPPVEPVAPVASAAPVPVAAAKPVVRRRSGGRVAMRVLTTIWASISVLNLVIWGLVFVTTGHLPYPWFIWVAAPPGAVLGTIWLGMNSGRGHDR